nr:proteasome subunit beta type-3 [Paratrimastix eleionoma]
MDPMSYNGSACLAMKGKNCVAICSDLHFGTNNLFVCRTAKIFPITPKTFVGFTGLHTDSQTIHETLHFRSRLFALREGKEMSPKAVTQLTSTLLYEKRFSPYYCEPIIAGLDADNKPYIAGLDLLGCIASPEDFVCSGTTSENMMGVAESFWKPDLEAEPLFQAISQTLMAGLNRDCLAGWGAVVHIITPEKVITRYLKSRQD